MESRAFTAAACAAALVLGLGAFAALGHAAGATSGDATEYTWSMELDCSMCHQKEVASLASSETDGQDRAQTEAAGEKADAAGADADAAGEKAGAEKAGTGTTSTGVEKAGADEPNADDAAQADRLAAIDGYAAMHATSFGLSCTGCHVESEGLDKAHAKLNSGKEAKRLKKSEVESAVCVTCHQTDVLAEATTNYQGVVDNNGTVVNPHALPETESHESVNCTDCHQVHSGKSITDTAMTTCTSCHHAAVFECNTCH